MPEEIEEQDQQIEEDVFEEKSNKKVLYISIIAVQLIIAAFVIWKFVSPEYDKLDEANSALEELQGESYEYDSSEPRELGEMYTFDNLTVNPKGTRGMRFAVFQFSVEVPSESEKEMITRYRNVLIDNYIAYFRNKSMKELARDSMLDTLKIDIRKISNRVLGGPIVQDVYFTQFVLE